MEEFENLKPYLKSKIDKLQGNQNIILDGADRFTAGGYIQFPKFAFYDLRLSDAQRSCYAAILNYAFNNNETVPGQPAMADLLGVHRNTISRSLKQLEALGYISTIKRKGTLTDVIFVHYTVSEMLAQNDYAPVPIAFDTSKLGVSLTHPDNADLRTTHGWIEVPAILYNHREFPTLNDSDRTVYAVLLDYAFGKGSCYPSQETLGSRIGKKPRTIEDNIKKLKDAGLITSERRENHLNNIYELKLRVNKKRA